MGGCTTRPLYAEAFRFTESHVADGLQSARNLEVREVSLRAQASLECREPADHGRQAVNLHTSMTVAGRPFPSVGVGAAAAEGPQRPQIGGLRSCDPLSARCERSCRRQAAPWWLHRDEFHIQPTGKGWGRGEGEGNRE